MKIKTGLIARLATINRSSYIYIVRKIVAEPDPIKRVKRMWMSRVFEENVNYTGNQRAGFP